MSVACACCSADTSLRSVAMAAALTSTELVAVARSQPDRSWSAPSALETKHAACAESLSVRRPAGSATAQAGLMEALWARSSGVMAKAGLSPDMVVHMGAARVAEHVASIMPSALSQFERDMLDGALSRLAGARHFAGRSTWNGRKLASCGP